MSLSGCMKLVVGLLAATAVTAETDSAYNVEQLIYATQSKEGSHLQADQQDFSDVLTGKSQNLHKSSPQITCATEEVMGKVETDAVDQAAYLKEMLDGKQGLIKLPRGQHGEYEWVTTTFFDGADLTALSDVMVDEQPFEVVLPQIAPRQRHGAHYQSYRCTDAAGQNWRLYVSWDESKQLQPVQLVAKRPPVLAFLVKESEQQLTR